MQEIIPNTMAIIKSKTTIPITIALLLLDLLFGAVSDPSFWS
jgi:hypothetical protein